MQSAGVVAQTIILAAGSGSRLGGASGVPKPLMTVAERPLIAHALAHARDSGCSEAIVVVGYAAARVKAAVERLDGGLTIRFVENSRFDAPNGESLLAAEPAAAPTFFLQMVDHVFGEIALPKLTARPLMAGEAGRVLVDRAPRGLDLEDATKVRLAGARVCAIGKRLEPWDAIDAGCFVLTRAVFEALRRAPAGEPRTVSSGMRQLAAQEALGFADLDGVAWMDVDTPSDRDWAESMMQRSPEVGV
jgi:CDP-L-myo-inositol myo-inositolphosphotransferase